MTMTDQPANPTIDQSNSTETTDPEQAGTAGDDGDHSAESDLNSAMKRYAIWGAFGLLSIVAVVATVGLYTSVSAAIDVWISSDYQPVFRALFNLVVVLVCALGLSVLIRRIDVPGRS
jgi:hypothetical protein